MSDQEREQLGAVAIMKELSDIKQSLAVNTNETANIKTNIAEIKENIKDIKMEAVGRREFNDALVTVRNEISASEKLANERIDPLRRIVYGLIALVGASLIPAILNLISRIKDE